jgi:subtilisin family serine protease
LRVKILLSLITMAAATNSYGREPLKVIILDTGYKPSTVYSPSICDGGHLDASQKDPKPLKLPPLDLQGHGTHIAGVIHQVATDSIVGVPGVDKPTEASLRLFKESKADGFCFLFIKYYREENSGRQNVDAYLRALKYIQTVQGPKIVNYSGGGPETFPEEQAFQAEMRRQGVPFIVAAGNDGKSFYDRDYTYFPAMGSYGTVVGAYYITDQYDDRREELRVARRGKKEYFFYKLKQSNYGMKGMVWHLGVLYGPGLRNDIVEMRGTSQATAVETGMAIKRHLEQTRRQDEFSVNSAKAKRAQRDPGNGGPANGPNRKGKARPHKSG